MDPALVVVLSEHLSQIAKEPENLPHSENISQSEAAWLMAQNDFLDLEQKFNALLYEWQAKWQQRFEIEGTASVVAEGAREIRKIKHSKEREKQARDLYSKTVHLMIDDVEKYIVSLNNRIDFLQENVRNAWYKSCSGNSWSKILPAIENSFQSYEDAFFYSKREQFFESQKDSAPIARQEFLRSIMANDNCDLILNFYFSKILRRVSKISSELCRFYSKKWTLYARGFSCRQNLLPLG
uniref:Uncharacterized protein n=1 Tax=uncultured bacterium contig00078 TaxID=1181556 RepID=A0A806KH10_9BACT|nr:hypothetical protein [uncultured bacterium contig00078]